jgi:hypothetical protein
LQIDDSSLEGEAYLRVDAAIVSRIAGAKTAETAGGRSRLAKQQRTQIANRVSKIGVVKYVVEVQRERQAIAATGVSTTAATTAAAAAEAAAPATTTATSSAAALTPPRPPVMPPPIIVARCRSLPSWLPWLPWLIPLICLCARSLRTKTKGFA